VTELSFDNLRIINVMISNSPRPRRPQVPLGRTPFLVKYTPMPRTRQNLGLFSMRTIRLPSKPEPEALRIRHIFSRSGRLPLKFKLLSGCPDAALSMCPQDHADPFAVAKFRQCKASACPFSSDRQTELLQANLSRCVAAAENLRVVAPSHDQMSWIPLQ